MNFKKISLLLMALSLVFTAEAFAKFSVRPLGPEDRRTGTVRKTRVMKPRAVQQSRTRKSKRSWGVRQRKHLVKSFTRNQNTRARRGRTVGSVTPVKNRWARRHSSVRPVSVDPLMKRVSKKRAGADSVPTVNYARLKQFKVPERNGQWQALYVLDNETIVMRKLDRIEIKNGLFTTSCRGFHCSRGSVVNNMRVKHNVDLSLNQTQDRFLGEVSKLGTINRAFPILIN